MTTPTTTRRVTHWSTVVTLWLGLALAVLEVLIGLRIALKLAGATAGNGFVDLVYDLSEPFVRPFEGIFDERIVGTDGIFEPQAVIAAAVYPLLYLLITAILRALVASAPQQTTSAWSTTARDVYVRLSALHGSVSSSVDAQRRAGGQGIVLIEESAVEMEDISTTLHSLELDPPSQRAGLAVRDLILALNRVRADVQAVDATTAAAAATAAPDAPPAARPAAEPRLGLMDSLSALDAALQKFRSAI